MKYLYLAVIVLFVSSCSSVKKVGSSGETYKISKEFSLFLADFENAAKNHKKVALLNLMDKAYKKEQLSEMLEGRTDQFLNEFFAGYSEKEKGFKAPGFQAVKALVFVSLTKTDENSYDVVYIIKTEDFEITRDWQVILRTIKGKTVFGLVGAFG